MASYLPEELLGPVFTYIGDHYARAEEVPAYRDEPGFDELCAILTRVKEDAYYPAVLEKAVYLLIGINKGHFFSNGNKRLALVITTLFLIFNNLVLKFESKEWYREALEALFPEYAQWEDFGDFTPTDFATYNLSIMIADSGVYDISHDELKRRVLVFFEKATEVITNPRA